MVRKKISLILLLSLVLLCSVGYSVIAQEYRDPSVRYFKETNTIKTFVGQPGNDNTMLAYKASRDDAFEKLVDKNFKEDIDCLIVFNQFLSSDEVEKIIKNSDLSLEINRIWLTKPNLIGIGVERPVNNDIVSAVESWGKGFQEHMNQLRKYNASINENMEAVDTAIKNNEIAIYAMLVKGNSNEIQRLKDYDSVLLADVHFNEEAEKLAIETGAKVRYIDIPKRPDNLK